MIEEDELPTSTSQQIFSTDQRNTCQETEISKNISSYGEKGYRVHTETIKTKQIIR